MTIGVLGAGAIGRYVGGALIASGADVAIATRHPDELGALTLIGLGGEVEAELSAERVRAHLRPSLTGCDVVLCCVKSTATESAAATIAATSADEAPPTIISLQNGLRNVLRLRAALPGHRVLAGIVGFNVVRDDPIIRRTTSGPIAIEASDAPEVRSVVAALRAAGLAVDLPADIERHQWTKLLVNLGNAVSALSNAPTRDLMLSRGYRRVIASLIAEALTVLRAANIRPARLRGLPVGWMPALLRLPTPILRVVARAQLRVDPEARSSMWDDLVRGRPTEVDDLNGEIVRRAEEVGVPAPRNHRIVELVQAAVTNRSGTPGMSAATLAGELAGAGITGHEIPEDR